jgi:hypothetical protein
LNVFNTKIAEALGVVKEYFEHVHLLVKKSLGKAWPLAMSA